MVASSVAGALLGTVLGRAGTIWTIDQRVVLAMVLALLGAVVGIHEFVSGRIAPLQCSRETPQAWLSRGPIRWALWNGAALGSGATTRIGFWLWYAVPLGALLSGSAEVGALIYGTYALVRGLAPVGCLLLLRRLHRLGLADGDSLATWLLLRRPAARAISGAALASVAIAAAILVG